jgi:predicted DNA-binding transcriptional regulator AlpA
MRTSRKRKSSNAKRARDGEYRRQAKLRRAALRQTLPADNRHLNPFTVYRPGRLADLLDVDRTCIWRWTQNGTLPEPITIGGVKGWTFSQLENLFAQRQQQAGGR